MPNIRRRRARRRPDVELDKTTRSIFLLGHDWFQTFGDPPDLARMAEIWSEHSRELTGEWIAQHPGTRPWGWWKFDAPEPRRRVLSGSCAADDPDAPEWVREAIAWGICSLTGQKQVDDPPVYETQVDYLRRHGLLTAAEREAIAMPGFEEFDPYEAMTAD